MIRARSISLLVACLSLWAAGQLVADDETPSQMDLLDEERKLSVGDRIIYLVVEEKEPGVQLFVNDRGLIDFPLIGRYPASGKTCKELAYELKALLEVDFFHQATVLIRHQFGDNSRGRVNVVGRVARPGPVNIPADDVLTVSDVILRVGGVLPGGNRRAVEIVREDPDDPEGQIRLEVDLADILDNGNLRADQVVKPGDVIVVPETESHGGTYYVTGSVNAPGEYSLPADGSDFTLSQAILKAGGFTRFANQDAVILIRQTEEGETRRSNVDVQSILEEGRRENDLILRADDIIRVNERFFNIY